MSRTAFSWSVFNERQHNALKHGADGHWVGLRVSRKTDNGRDEVLISVSDKGHGIDAVDLPHVCEPFYRGRRAVDAQIQGNGLGLSLVTRIAEAHGGRMAVKSAAGTGTTVTLHLPAASAEQVNAE